MLVTHLRRSIVLGERRHKGMCLALLFQLRVLCIERHAFFVQFPNDAVTQYQLVLQSVQFSIERTRAIQRAALIIPQ